jgi:hypothetical protein
LIDIDEKLSLVLSGALKPQDAATQLRFADFCCRYKNRYATAVGFYQAAFAADAKVADELKGAHRYGAACAAALAAAGKGEDAAKLDDAKRAALRQQALAWLQADLKVIDTLLLAGKPEARQHGQKMLQVWQKDPDLASLRGEAIGKLPDEERTGWTKLWGDVADRIKE